MATPSSSALPHPPNPAPPEQSASDAAFTVALEWLAAACAGVSAPTGAGSIFIVAEGALIWPNAKWPGSFIQAASNWETISSAAQDATTELNLRFKQSSPFMSYWQGDGAKAFNDFVTNRLIPDLGDLQSQADNMQKLCSSMTIGLIAFDGGVIIAYITALIALIMSWVTAETGVLPIVLQWAIALKWLATIATLVTAGLGAAFSTVKPNAFTIETAVTKLNGELFDQKENILYQSMQAVDLRPVNNTTWANNPNAGLPPA